MFDGESELVLTVIKTFGWKVKTMDIKTAYLQGKESSREVYIKPTEKAKCSKIMVFEENCLRSQGCSETLVRMFDGGVEGDGREKKRGG